MTWYLLARCVLVPGCCVVMDMDKDTASEEVLVAGRPPAATACDAAYNIEEEQGRDGERWQVLGLSLPLVLILIYTSSHDIVISFCPRDLIYYSRQSVFT